MKLPFFIAFRYLISKKKHNIINVISGISICGITFGTMALIIVLSVFNGFEALVITMFNSINPDLHISVNEGKTFELDSIQKSAIKKIKGVVYYTEVVEENVLLKYNDKQHIAVIKGVSNDFFKMSKICKLIFNGNCEVKEGDVNYALIGNGVATVLDINTDDYLNMLSIYVPRKGTRSSTDPTKAFNYRLIQPGGLFSVEYEYDSKYIITDIAFARDLLSYNKEVTAVEIGIDSGFEIDKVKSEVQKILGNSYTVKNRFEQQEILYKVMKSEKWAVFLILTFILLIAIFNVIGTLTMLVIEKKNDISILWTLGANNKLLKKIFFIEGVFISFSGAVIGLFLGGIICLIQQIYGVITMNSGRTFVVDAYPVKMQFIDFFLVFITVMIIGVIAAYIPIRKIKINSLEKGR